jgi:hypothetical protein
MKRKNSLHHVRVALRYLVSPDAIFNMLSEILFPRKMVTLGSLLFLLVLILLFLMISGILQASFEVLFLALLITVAGVALCLIGCTCYIGNRRA